MSILYIPMVPEVEVTGRKVFVTLSDLAAASHTNISCFIPPSKTAKYKLNAVTERHHVAGGSGATAQFEVCGAAVAPGSGVNQLDTAIDLTATADTSQIALPTKPTIFDYTSVVNLVLSGTLTGLANCNVTLEFEKVN